MYFHRNKAQTHQPFEFRLAFGNDRSGDIHWTLEMFDTNIQAASSTERKILLSPIIPLWGHP